MEYRKRKRRIRRPAVRRNDTAVAYTVVVCVFFGIVYLISASRFGTWLAVHWVAPVFAQAEQVSAATAAPAATDTPKPVEREETSIDVPAQTCYALQIGVYSSKENAEQQAKSLQQIGAAGYIVQDGDRYRVLAAGYTDEESCNQVGQQLLQEGIESRVYEMPGGTRTLRITATQSQLSALQSAVNGMPTLLAGLYDLAIRFDKETMRIDQGVVSLRSLYSAAMQCRDALADVKSENEPELAGIESFYNAVLSGMDQAMEITEKIPFTANLKYLYLSAMQSYQTYTGMAVE